ncbi:MAG: hypothetical protein ACTHMR_17770, partial [Thermomicrobiales bacterium]
GLTAVAKSLWNGTSNDAAPAGWTAVEYDDSAWAAAVEAQNAGGTRVPITGTLGLWATTRNLSESEQCLVRQRFTLPTGRIVSATLTGKLDDAGTIYINGTQVYTNTTVDVEEESVTVDPALLVAGGANVIAVLGIDQPAVGTPPANDYAYVSFKLGINV